ncbi:uncharacterized protein LOC130645905 [Hydractinia symbiolongicarpus]|uniref:uncharacterized protein LOC130645905 n=1 Tax=Hydractinia symbiolongicarpus TaxID=13093 RepID=UPI0025516592|nr:uncharacterized protein LOC130645905 [Hydractinia symbiolongicarpus]
MKTTVKIKALIIICLLYDDVVLINIFTLNNGNGFLYDFYFNQTTEFYILSTLIKGLIVIIIIAQRAKSGEKFGRSMEKFEGLLQVQQICEKFWSWRMANFPEFATLAGEHKFDHMLHDFSLDAFQKRTQDATSFLAEVNDLLKSLEESGIQAACYDDLDMLSSHLKTFVDGMKHRAYLCPVNRLEGPQCNFFRLLQHMKTDTPDDFEKILCRLSLLPKQIDQMIELMKEGIRTKTTLHECSILPPVLVNDSEWKVIAKKAEQITNDQINSAFIKLADFINDNYLKHTRNHIGLDCLFRGKEMYKSCLQYHTSTTMSAREIHTVGLKEVKRICQRINEVMQKMNFGGSYNDFCICMDRESPYFSAHEILKDYSLIYQKIVKELPKIFAVLPKEDCLIKPVPKEEEATAITAFYKDGNENRAGVFYINTHKPRNRGRYKTTALVLHEAIPGHHLQSDVFLRKKDTPKFRRFLEGGNYQMIPGRFPLYTAFMEGWGLYSEFLGEELHLYDSLSDLYGRLKSEMLRACRLVVDTGIHTFGWSRNQAIEYLMCNVGLSQESASGEVDRYITWPGQACAYKIGELKFLQLRQQAHDLLGERFDVKEFHGVLLNNGAVSMDFLQKQVKSYIFTKMSLHC